MIKKYLLIISVFATTVASAYDVKVDLYYNLNKEDYTAEVTYKDERYNSYGGAIVIPSWIEYQGVTYSVTSIGTFAFRDCASLESVVIPGGLNKLGIGAFYGCSSLATVRIGSGVKTIHSKMSLGGDSIGTFANCPELKDVYCYAEEVPKTGLNTFDGSYIGYATLHVPYSVVDEYKSKAPWSSFKTVDAMGPKCAKPTISFQNGQVIFACATPGVQFVSEVTTTDTQQNYSSRLVLSGVYRVSVYATRTGYENSDVTTTEIRLSVKPGEAGLVGDVNKDGTVDVADISKVLEVMASNAVTAE